VQEKRLGRHHISAVTLFVLFGTASCQSEIPLTESEIPLPKPAPMRVRRERDDWVKPGKMLVLGNVYFRPGREAMRILNREPFSIVPLDDIWLLVSAPNAQVRTDGPYIGNGRQGWNVYLRCPAPDVIPGGSEVDVSFQPCLPTTYEPGPGAVVIGARLTAREGYRELPFGEGGIPLATKRP